MLTNRLTIFRIRAIFAIWVFLAWGRVAAADELPDPVEVRIAVARASAFMMDRLAYRGGFVWKYSLDLRERYGELKARNSMAWDRVMDGLSRTRYWISKISCANHITCSEAIARAPMWRGCIG